MKKYAPLIFVAIVIIVSGGAFALFHTTPSICTEMRDPSGMMSQVCTLGMPSPYQRFLIMQHKYFFPNDMCAININTGALDCRSLSASGCDQSATTTPCSEIEALAKQNVPPSSYRDPNIVEPIARVETSAINATVTLDHFSFSLPPGWYGEEYLKGGGAGYHWIFQRNQDDRGFIIDCPPDGKGLEAAVTLSREDRSFSDDGIVYAISLRQMTAPGNEPWFMVFVTKPQSQGGGPECLTWGTATPKVEEAIRELYATWSGKDADAGGVCGKKQRFEGSVWWSDFKKKTEQIDFYRDNDVETILQQARDNAYLNPTHISYTYDTFCAVDQFKRMNICADGRQRKVSFDDASSAYFEGCLLDGGTFISVFPGEYPSNGNHVFGYDTKRGVLKEAVREKEEWGHRWNVAPQIFGARDGSVIKMRGETGDAGASVTSDFSYDIAANQIRLIRSCSQEIGAQPQCVTY